MAFTVPADDFPAPALAWLASSVRLARAWVNGTRLLAEKAMTRSLEKSVTGFCAIQWIGYVQCRLAATIFKPDVTWLRNKDLHRPGH